MNSFFRLLRIKAVRRQLRTGRIDAPTAAAALWSLYGRDSRAALADLGRIRAWIYAGQVEAFPDLITALELAEGYARQAQDDAEEELKDA